MSANPLAGPDPDAAICIDVNCNRKHRPDNSHYSKDPKVRMAQLKEEGRVGGAEFGAKGGRPKKPRASALVAERLQEHADEVSQVYIDGLRSQDDRIRLQAAREGLDVEARETKLQMEEEKHEKEMSKDELISGIKGMLENDPVLKLAMENMLSGKEISVDYELEAAE